MERNANVVRRMWKHAVIVVLAVAVYAGTPVAATTVVPSNSLGTVEFALKPCPLAISHPFTGGTVTYQIFGDGGGITEKFPWDSRDSKPLHLTAQLTPGVYTYAVNGRYVSGNQLVVGCQAYWYLAVLPGDTRHIRDQMLDCCGDPIPMIYIDGLVSSAVRIRAVRFDNTPGCDAPLAGLTPTPIDVERNAVGYYAKGSLQPGLNEGKVAVFGIEIQRASGESRMLRVMSDYATHDIMVPPKLARMDLTNGLLAAAFAKPSGTLLCPAY
jgi:hypothetical protein